MLITGKAETAAPDWRDSCKRRWGVDPLKPVPVEDPFKRSPMTGSDNSEETLMRYITGEEMLYMVADNTCKSSPEDASRKILQDFRAGRMGNVCLQVAPEGDASSSMAGADFSQVPDPRMGTMRTEGMMPTMSDWEQHRAKMENERQERAKTARETAKERGLELPPQLEQQTTATTSNSGESSSDSNDKREAPEGVGKGLFDGW